MSFRRAFPFVISLLVAPTACSSSESTSEPGTADSGVADAEQDTSSDIAESGPSDSGGDSGSDVADSASSDASDAAPVEGTLPEGLLLSTEVTLTPSTSYQIFAYTSTASKMLTAPAGPHASELTQGSNSDGSVTPDGKRILFASGRDIPYHTGLTNPTLRALYTMKLDGTDVTRVTTEDLNHCNEKQARYSHDGAHIGFIRVCDNVGTKSNYELPYIMNADGTSITEVPIPASHTALFPSWSRDDQTFYFVDFGPSATTSDLYAYDVASKTVTKLTDNTADKRTIYSYPSIATSGDIYFTTEADLTAPKLVRLERMHADGTGRTVVYTFPNVGTDSLGGMGMFALSPDETHVAFAMPAPGGKNVQIAVSALDGSGLTVIGKPTMDIRWMSWQPLPAGL